MQRPLRSVPPPSVSIEPVVQLSVASSQTEPLFAPTVTAWSRSWRLAAALIVAAIFWLLAWYGETVASIVSIWLRSETFTHGFLVLPIAGWMVWHRRRTLAAIEPRPNWSALAVLALAGFAWLLGDLASVGVVQQFAVAIMISLIVWAVLGTQVTVSLGFPLFYVLFAVPFGEFMVPALMTYTADFTALALRLTGIPVYREGQMLTVPSGTWSVVEACGGLRYLIASLTLGVLYAYLMYRSVVRRALFIAASIIVPIIANWVRAYMIVMIGHLSGMKYAVGVDHFIYGWVFFGVVMLLLLWIGSFWREDLHTERESPGPAFGPFPLGRIMLATIAATVVAGAWPVAASILRDSGGNGIPHLREPVAAGWQPTAGTLAHWSPHFENPSARLHQTYSKGAQRVGVYMGYYSRQRQGAELITSQNVLVHSSNTAWIRTAERSISFRSTTTELSIVESRLRGRTADLLAWHWYWVDGQYTVNPYWAKLLQAKSQLLGRGDDAAVVIVYTESDLAGNTARERLKGFVDDLLPGISQTLGHAR